MKNTVLNAVLERLEQIKNGLREVSRLTDGCYRFTESIGAGAVDYPEEGWMPLPLSLTYAQEDGVLWVRFRVTVPERVWNVPVAGGQIRLRSWYQAPVEMYVDGQLRMKEDNWLDLQTPELVLAEEAVPGTVYHCAQRIHCAGANWGGGFNAWVEFDPVDRLVWMTESMQQELSYAATLPGGEALLQSFLTADLPGLTEMAEDQDASGLEALYTRWRSLAEPLRAEAKKLCVHMVSHAHIDMNWLWGMQETRDLVQRDFTTMCNLMDEFPDFCFSQSQGAAYEMAQQDDPALFQRMREYVKEGRWEITGSAWVEHDSNMPSGESLARHLLYTQRYTDEALGARSTIQWAPDTFGHGGNLPQLLRKSGISHYFHTRCMPALGGDIQKQVLNGEAEPNLYVWEGIDGSRVLSSTMGYGMTFTLAAVLDRARQAKKAGLTDAMCAFGVGDHGGGPTRRDIRQAHYCGGSPMLPRIVISTIQRYFDAVESQKEAVDALLVHKGELNFVFEGCYTSTSDIKYRNRLLETRLAEVEALGRMAECVGRPYPAELLKNSWKTLLFHHFHDIMDGCAVSGTYREAREVLGGVERRLDAEKQAALAVLTAPAEDTVTVWNLIPYTRGAWVTLDIPADKVAVDEKGAPLQQEPTADGKRAVYLPELPPFGCKTVTLTEGKAPVPIGMVEEKNGCYVISGPDYEVWLKKSSGEIVTLYDRRTQRFVVMQGIRCSRMDRGALNTFYVTDELTEIGMASWVLDRPRAVQYLNSGAECRLVEDGPLRKRIQVRHHHRASVITQDILFDFTTPVIRFETDVEWREAGSRQLGTPMLHVGFAPQLSHCRLYNEVPFGVITRDTADAELPQQRFSALEDGAGGMILYNDCKYGVHIAGNLLSLSLLRSSWEPDPHGDIGHHHFAYGLEFYGGELKDTAVLKTAAGFHSAPVCVPGTASAGMVWPDMPRGVVLSGLKRAEDADETVLRLYEAFGEARTVTLPLPAAVAAVEETTTDELSTLARWTPTDGAVTLELAPYEIKTLRLRQ